MNVQDMSASEQ